MIDIVLFIIFLGLNLILGLRAGRKVTTLRQYAIGDKNFSTSTLTATIIATWFGGGSLFYCLKEIYTTGLHFVIANLGGCICLLLMGRVLGIRMGEFLNNLSVAEVMGDLYGKYIRIITAVGGILRGVGGVAIQFLITKKMISLIFGVEDVWVTILSSFIIIAYSAFGGIRAVTITDVFQFITFSIFIPILALIIWNNLQNPTKVISIIQENPIFHFRELVGWNVNFFSTIALMLYFAIPGLSPFMFQRILIAKDVKQVATSFSYAAGIELIITFFIVLLAVLLLSENAYLEPDKLVNYIINTHAYPGMKGLIAVGIIAMAMSTSDSILNSAAVIVINDLIKPLKSKYWPSITYIRLFSILIGVLALIISLYIQNILDIILLPASFYMPVITVPLTFAIFGFRSTSKSVLTGMVAGISTVIIWKIFYAYTNINSVIPGMLGNILFFMGSHYILKQKGGWVGIKEKAPLITAKITRQRCWASIKQSILKPRPYSYFKKNLPSKEIFYTLFGIYILGATYGSFFIIPTDIRLYHDTLYNHIYHSVIIISSAFITYPLWPSTFKNKRFIVFAWPLSLLYVLFIIGYILLMMSGFHEVQMFIFLLNIVLVALLLDWPIWIGIITIGWLLAKYIFSFYGGVIPTTMPDHEQFRLLYGLPFVIIFVIALIRFKQAKKGREAEKIALMLANKNMSQDLLESYQNSYKFLKKMQESGIHKLYDIVNLIKKMDCEIEKTDNNQKIIQDIKNLNDQLTPLAYHLDQIENRTIGYLKLNITTISIRELVEKFSKQLKIYNVHKYIQWTVTTKKAYITCDIEKIMQLMTNAVTFIQGIHQKKPIFIVISDTKLGYSLSNIQKDYTKKIEAIGITLTTKEYAPILQTIYKADKGPICEIVKTHELPLMSNHRIIQAHYGYHQTQTEEKQFTQVYVIPLDITTLRPKELNLTDPVIVEESIIENYPGVKEKENIFLEKIKKYPQINRSNIHKAIQFSKKNYGLMRRKSGEPFYLHPLAVADIVLDFTQNEETIIAALLHDIVEDTPMSLAQVSVLFNQNVAFLVEGVTNLSSDNDPNLYQVKLAPEENIQKLLSVGNSQILYIKIADRLHNMRTIQHKSIKSQKRIAEQTLLFFVPLARQLALHTASEALKNIAWKVINQE